MRWEGLLYYTTNLSLKKQSYESSLKKKNTVKRVGTNKRKMKKHNFFIFKKIYACKFLGVRCDVGFNLTHIHVGCVCGWVYVCLEGHVNLSVC